MNVAMDQFDNRIGRTKHLQVGEAEYLEPIRFEISISDRIFLDSFLSMVLPTIHLDDQLRSRSIEVDYILPNRSLSVEPNALDTLAPKVAPEPSFPLGHRYPELPRSGRQMSSVLLQAIPPYPPFRAAEEHCAQRGRHKAVPRVFDRSALFSQPQLTMNLS